MQNKLGVLFPVGALLISSIAYLNSIYFVYAKGGIIPLLAIVMFFMGMTLNWKHFKDALRQPLP